MGLEPIRSRYLALSGLGLLALSGLAGVYLSAGHGRLPDTAVAKAEPVALPGDLGRPSPLPLPSSMPVDRYEEHLFRFLNDREYVNLGWKRDKGVRDTGPYIKGTYYGTHPAVRVYYSPGVIRWLMNGREGPIPDGEMIIKEQYPPPADRHFGNDEGRLRASLESWTVMVKDSAGSHDGWFWSNPVAGQCVVDNHRYPFDHAVSGFGHYCVRCHASTHTPATAPADAANEFTFASLRNVEGFPGEPILFRVDDSWRAEARDETSRHDSHPSCARQGPEGRPRRRIDPGFAALFDAIKPQLLSEVEHLPPATHDWAYASRDPAQAFVTSNQCMGCHAGLTGPFGPSMFVPAGETAEYGDPGWHVSPYGEWRWTPMGLAGRDPVFFAQLESEIRILKSEFGHDTETAGRLGEALTDTCLRCHGAMGKRQFEIDHGGSRGRFTLDHVRATAGPDEHLGLGDSKYGALARDGISCAVCHRMTEPDQPADDPRPYLQFFLENSITGNYHLGEPGKIFGPFKDDDIAPYVMEHGIGMKPAHGKFLSSSRMCGTCHTVNLPVIDMPLADGEHDELARGQTVPEFKNFHHHLEQSTYLEWLNSDYENEFNPGNPFAKSCQDCHMSPGLKDEERGIDIPQIRSRIAAVQDTTYPDAENLAPLDQLRVPIREEGYRRHNFSGLNVFLVELFNQFDDVLGVPRTDFMTGSDQDIGNAVADFVRTARHDVADLEVTAAADGPGRLTARVLVTNKVGHRFPSGVAFRRAFLEFSVLDGSGEVVWASGRANDLGVLIGADGRPLPSEFFGADSDTDEQAFQPHHEVITSPDQVQIYETLLKDAGGRFTTSFVHGCERVKDNRLLPRGWKAEGPDPALTGAYLRATHPLAEAADDPRYRDGSGTDEVIYRVTLPDGIDPSRCEVRATLYYQAMPPYFLAQLFRTAPDGPATRRLHYLCSHVDLKGTPIEGWKLPITSATARPGAATD